MEKKMETTIMGFIGTTIGIHSFTPSYPKASLRHHVLQDNRSKRGSYLIRTLLETLESSRRIGEYWGLRRPKLCFKLIVYDRVLGGYLT